MIPAAGMTCEGLIQECHQLFVKGKRERALLLLTIVGSSV